MQGDEGKGIEQKTVPTMGSLDGTAKVASNPDDGLRAEGVRYNTDASVGETVTTNGYPAGTDFGESSNPLR